VSKNPASLIVLLSTWALLLLAGIGLVWQAFAEKARPEKSKFRNYLGGVKFRFRLLSGAVLIILVILGAVWFFAS
jgi:hypothetical protein